MSLVGPFCAYYLEKSKLILPMGFRPFITCLLCCVVLMGQLPALLHVVTCHKYGCTHSKRASTGSTACCSCSFHRRAAKAEVQSEQSEKRDSQSNNHDSDSCSICQSLYGPCGVAATISISIEVGDLVQWSPTYYQHHHGADALTIAQPRGPPTVAC